MNKLPLPLHCYDQAGRVLPPKCFWLSCLFLTKSWLIFLGSVTIRGKEKAILEFWFPIHHDLYISLALGLPALVAIILTSYREKLWSMGQTLWVYWVWGLISIAILAQFFYLLNRLVDAQFNYHHALAMSMAGVILISVYMLRSQHIRIMLQDWKR